VSARAFYVLVLSADAWPATSTVVRAERATNDGEVVTLWEGERAVHRVPARLVIALEHHDTKKAADTALELRREARVGGATVHVAELGVVTRVTRGRAGHSGHAGRAGQGTAIPAEGIRFVVSED